MLKLFEVYLVRREINNSVKEIGIFMTIEAFDAISAGHVATMLMARAGELNKDMVVESINPIEMTFEEEVNVTKDLG